MDIYIFNVTLCQVRTEINKEIEAVSKASDPLKILATADTMKLLGVQRPLLQVSYIQYFSQTQNHTYIDSIGQIYTTLGTSFKRHKYWPQN